MSLIGYQKGKKTEFRLFELEQEQSTDWAVIESSHDKTTNQKLNIEHNRTNRDLNTFTIYLLHVRTQSSRHNQTPQVRFFKMKLFALVWLQTCTW
jgi:hypothetical protein